MWANPQNSQPQNRTFLESTKKNEKRLYYAHRTRRTAKRRRLHIGDEEKINS